MVAEIETPVDELLGRSGSRYAVPVAVAYDDEDDFYDEEGDGFGGGAVWGGFDEDFIDDYEDEDAKETDDDEEDDEADEDIDASVDVDDLGDEDEFDDDDDDDDDEDDIEDEE